MTGNRRINMWKTKVKVIKEGERICWFQKVSSSRLAPDWSNQYDTFGFIHERWSRTDQNLWRILKPRTLTWGKLKPSEPTGNVIKKKKPLEIKVLHIYQILTLKHFNIKKETHEVSAAALMHQKSPDKSQKMFKWQINHWKDHNT